VVVVVVVVGGGRPAGAAAGEVGRRGDGEAAWFADVGVCWWVEVEPLAGEELWLGGGW
jgi:hypothetical protein